MLKTKILLTSLVVLLLCGTAFAQDEKEFAPTSAEAKMLGETIEELNRANSDIVDFENQVKLEELKLKLDKIKKEREEILTGGKKTTTGDAITGVGMAPAKPTPDGELPLIGALYGISGKLVAELIFEDGNVFKAKSGDLLPEGFKVKSVTENNVVLTRNGKSFVLKFAAPSEEENEDAG